MDQLWWTLNYNDMTGRFLGVFITEADSRNSALAWAFVANGVVANSVLTIMPFRATHVDRTYTDRLLTWEEALAMESPDGLRPAPDAPLWCEAD
jgi:hypothetical protein